MSAITLNLQQPTPHTAQERPRLAGLGGAIKRALITRRTRCAIAILSDTQLTDCGIDRAAVLDNKPVIEVDAHVMTYLQALR